MANIIPNNALRKVSRDVNVGGYLIPKNTTIVPQISTVLYNEEVLYTYIYKILPPFFSSL